MTEIRKCGELDQFNLLQLEQLIALKEVKLPSMHSGDTVKVTYGIHGVSGKIERKSVFEGVIIRIRRRNVSSSILVRKKTNSDVFVERLFFIYAPTISKIEVIRRGKVRRKFLSYLRNLVGKKAKIKELKEIKHKTKKAS